MLRFIRPFSIKILHSFVIHKNIMSSSAPSSRAELAQMIRAAAPISSVLAQAPSSFIFDADRLLYLSYVQEIKGNALCFTSLDSAPSSASSAAAEPTLLDRQILIESASRSDEPLSKEEQLLRERQRSAAKGISSYRYHASSRRTLLPAGPNIFLSEGGSPSLRPVSTSGSSKSPKLDSKFSPDGKLVAYICDGDIHVTAFSATPETDVTARLTTGRDRSASISCGVAEYIAQEEFDRFTGYWWNPKVTSNGGDVSQYQILYFEVDESQVPELSLPAAGIDSDVDKLRYPRVGQKNAKLSVHILDFSVSSSNAIVDVKTRSPSSEVTATFPWIEYITRAGWMKGGETAWIQALDRAQQRMSYITFKPSNLDDFQIVYTEESSAWINITNLITAVSDTQLLFGTENSTTSKGFMHLQLLDINTHTVRPITAGADWQVDNGALAIDDATKSVFFSGTKDGVLERHIYVASLNESSTPSLNVERITDLGFVYGQMTFNSDFSTMVVTRQSVSKASHPVIYKRTPASGLPQYSLQSVIDIPASTALSTLPFDLITPEFVETRNRHGEPIHGAVFKPAGYDPTKKYPLVVYVYGGPHVQLVTNEYRLQMSTTNQLLCHMGYMVAIFDGRGSNRRGFEFEAHLRCAMGTFELNDQRDAIQYLIDNTSWAIDPSHIACYGWSYGGYMSLMALAQHSDFFKVTVSCAPVTDWKLYDTGYTERYMGVPPASSSAADLSEADKKIVDGYKNGSVMSYMQQFPEEEGRSLLVHGMIDENVHLKHSEIFLDAAIKANKSVDFHMLPSERHGVRNPDTAVYYNSTLIRFLQKNL